MTEIELPLIDGKAPLSMNQRLHWREKARRTRDVVESVYWQAMALQPRLDYIKHVTVQLHFATGDNRRRDADNLVATLKPAIDGLVRAGVVHDDTPEYVTWHSPQIHTGKGQRRLWIEVSVTPNESVA